MFDFHKKTNAIYCILHKGGLSLFNRIKKLCEENNTSITKLCVLVTGSSGNLNTWKKGYMRTDYLQKIAEYFNVTTDYLITGQEKSPSSYLTENEQKLIDSFKSLTPMQQGEIIGRAQLMAEQNEILYRKEEIG